MRFEVVESLPCHVARRAQLSFMQPEPAQVPPSRSPKDRGLCPLSRHQLTLNGAPSEVMVPKEIGRHPRHVARPQHERLGPRHVFALGHIAQDDQITKDLRENVTQSGELRVLPQPLGRLDP